jgi:acetolactate synthase small subunit
MSGAQENARHKSDGERHFARQIATADLSREGKEHNAAAQAVADFEASQTLARAREAVELAVAKHDIKPEARDAMLKAMNQAELSRAGKGPSIRSPSVLA